MKNDNANSGSTSGETSAAARPIRPPKSPSDEAKAVADLARTLPFGEEYSGVIAEFSERQSRESLLAHDADQLEMILALKEYKDLGNRYADEWYPFAVRRLKTEIAQHLAETIWSTDSTRWWFDDDSDWWVKGRKESEE